MPNRDVVVVGASAGGVEALRALVGGLPADLAAAVLVVLHVPRSAPSALPSILNRSGPLPARTAIDGESLAHGRLYVPSMDRHLLIIDGRIRLSPGPAENGHRPAIDPLFRSAARAYGPRVVGVVLSGSRDDGAAGLAAIVDAGGVAVVQDPADALHPSMPRSALEQTTVDHVVPADKMGRLIAELVRSEVLNSANNDSDLLDAEVAMADYAPLSTDELDVPPAGYGCPNCGGALFEIHSRPVPRFRCRVGHAWSPDSLLEEHAIALEGALWMALRTLEEKKALSQRMASNGAERDLTETAIRYRMFADEAGRAVDLIRDLIGRLGRTSEVEDTHSGE
jgi:two-component system, chemotaxis family, protein-glutamate methylesterase/glutaminase